MDEVMLVSAVLMVVTAIAIGIFLPGKGLQEEAVPRARAASSAD
jgi:hypothetical protein